MFIIGLKIAHYSTNVLKLVVPNWYSDNVLCKRLGTVVGMCNFGIRRLEYQLKHFLDTIVHRVSASGCIF